MSYVLCLETLERLATAATQAALLARALGRDVDVPDWFTIRADFDTALAAPPQRMTAAQMKRATMLAAVGLREGVTG